MIVYSNFKFELHDTSIPEVLFRSKVNLKYTYLDIYIGLSYFVKLSRNLHVRKARFAMKLNCLRNGKLKIADRACRAVKV